MAHHSILKILGYSSNLMLKVEISPKPHREFQLEKR
jgi:hypothetical protein